MRWFWSVYIPKWYILFVGGIFLVIAMLSGIVMPFYYGMKQADELQPIFGGNPSERKVALACNVFWGEEFLPDMLNIFDQYQVKVTFFIGGSWAKRYPELLKELAARGHELGNHTYGHPHPNRLTKEQNKEQIIAAETLVQQYTGIKTNLYAPPYGEYNQTVLLAAHELGYRTIMWSIDTVDWKRPPAEVICSRVLKKLHNGAIILMHPTEPTAKALPQLIEQMQKQGYEFVTVSDLLK